MDRLLSFGALGLAGLALIGAVLVERQSGARIERISTELAAISQSVEQLVVSTGQVTAADNGTIDALFALQDRIAVLEQAWRTGPAGGDGLITSSTGRRTTAGGDTGNGECIPKEMRFVMQPGESYDICESDITVLVSEITAEGATLEGLGTIPVGSLQQPEGTPCTVSVLTADAAGFVELKVSCF